MTRIRDTRITLRRYGSSNAPCFVRHQTETVVPPGRSMIEPWLWEERPCQGFLQRLFNADFICLRTCRCFTANWELLSTRSRFLDNGRPAR